MVELGREKHARGLQDLIRSAQLVILFAQLLDLLALGCCWQVRTQARPSRVGGVLALGRIVYRSLDVVDWSRVVSLADENPRGSAGMRRLAALIEVFEQPVPSSLASYAIAHRPARSMLLDDADIYGWRGENLKRFGVVLNVPVEALREEVRR